MAEIPEWATRAAEAAWAEIRRKGGPGWSEDAHRPWVAERAAEYVLVLGPQREALEAEVERLTALCLSPEGTIMRLRGEVERLTRERDKAGREVQAAVDLCQIYYDIAANALGEEKVRALRDAQIPLLVRIARRALGEEE